MSTRSSGDAELLRDDQCSPRMIPRDHQGPNAARFARATASFASGRGGSMMPMRPRKTRPCSTRSSGCAVCSARPSVVSQRPATPSVRRARFARASFVWRIVVRRRGEGRDPSDEFECAPRQHTSGAPLVSRYPWARRACADGACSSACARTKTGPPRHAEIVRRAPRSAHLPCGRRRVAHLPLDRPGPSTAHRARVRRRCLRDRRPRVRVPLDSQRAVDCAAILALNRARRARIPNLRT